jgi:hypothetical protein
MVTAEAEETKTSVIAKAQQSRRTWRTEQLMVDLLRG